MDRLKQKLLVEQIDKRLAKFRYLENETLPPEGWIYTIRKALRMSLRQLGKRLDVSPQGVKQVEMREKDGSLTIKRLFEIGNAMNMRFVYGFLPNEGSISKMIENRAAEIAKNIVMRTAGTMELENQKVDEQRLIKAIKDRTEEIIINMPRYLWD